MGQAQGDTIVICITEVRLGWESRCCICAANSATKADSIRKERFFRFNTRAAEELFKILTGMKFLRGAVLVKRKMVALST